MSIFSRQDKPKQNKMLKPLSSKGENKGGGIADKVMLVIALVLFAGVAVGAVLAASATATPCLTVPFAVEEAAGMSISPVTLRLVNTV